MKHEKCSHPGFIVKPSRKSGSFLIAAVSWLAWPSLLYTSTSDNSGERRGLLFCSGAGCGVEVLHNGPRGTVLSCLGVSPLKKKKRRFVHRLQNPAAVGYTRCLVYVNETLISEVLGFCFRCCTSMEVCRLEEFKLFSSHLDEGTREFLGFGIGWLLRQELVCSRAGMS